ncbi:MAG: hypothetical protein WC858_02695 [Parcubacteria group bacterium]|jgi:hypothetical protein
MKGRIQTKSKKTPNNKRKIKSGVKVAAAKKFFSSQSKKADTKELKIKWHKDNLRFGVSLIVLTALLEAALFMFLLVLNNSTDIAASKANAYQAPIQTGAVQKKIASSAEKTVKDDGLDYEVTIPKEIGDWMYKTGYVKSLVDDTLSDEYLQIYMPLPAKSGGNKFEGRYQNILTIMRFTEEEWDDIDKGCAKSDLYYCDTQGKELDRKDGYVYSYTAPADCPKEISYGCGKTDQIVGSFKLK